MILFMNKNIFAFILAVCIVFGLFGCHSEEISPGTTATDSQTLPSEDSTVGTIPNEGPANLDTAPTTESTEPPSNPTEETTPSTATEPEETTEPTHSETESDATETTAPSEDTTELTDFEKYHSMSGQEQQAFINSFESIEDFFTWYNAAKAEYEAQNPGINVGDGDIDLGGGKN